MNNQITPQADSQPAPVGGAAELLKEILAAACCEESETNLTSDQYRKLYDLHSSIQAISTPPAQAADSVQEDAETALRKVLGVVQRYLPPDGPSAHDSLSEIIEIVDPWPLGPLEKP